MFTSISCPFAFGCCGDYFSDEKTSSWLCERSDKDTGGGDQTPACKLQLAWRQRDRGRRTLRLPTEDDGEEEEDVEDDEDPEPEAGALPRMNLPPSQYRAWPNGRGEGAEI
ncbi:hypothetical protein SKAU_G00355980 [Synaphobranchus kaupii]|uniref:Uncharacterized protein n=1 Tax=Synaphobranchus kaupii TaxID=118154 RepID=A0A9Q1EHF3_SYNKA|nr:hypothetical protein SKAU_G00355980 [Synaphobranchus kaupii]